MMPRTILVADDEDAVRKAVCRMLEFAGYRVVAASDGQEALQKAEEEKPELLILDMMMPRLHGYEVCQQLRQREDELAQVPVIILTGLEAMLGESLAEEGGAQRYLTKPVNPNELLGIIEELLKKV